MINLFMMLILLLAWLLTSWLGAHFYESFGLWGMLPAIVLGLLFGFLAFMGLLKSLREARDMGRRRKASLDELLTEYKDAARTYAAMTKSEDYVAAIKAADLLALIYLELRRRGEDAQRSLLPLLGDKHPGVRLWSASHALQFAPSQGEAVLRDIISDGGFLEPTAKTRLERWEQEKAKKERGQSKLQSGL